MGEAPERITHTDLVRGPPDQGYVERDTSYTRTDLYDRMADQRDGWKAKYDEAVRQRDFLLDAAKDVQAMRNSRSIKAGQAWANMRHAIAACEGSEAG